MTVKKSLIFAAYGVGILLACALAAGVCVIYKDNKTIDLSEQYQERLGEYCVALQERDFA